MTLSEYRTYDALGLANLVKKGDATALELAKLALEAIDNINPELNAVLEVFEDPLENLVNTGITNAPFAGVPFLVKDLILHMQGRKCEMGSRLCQDMIAPHDTHLAAKFKDAGLITLGRTATPEMGFCTTTESLLNGPTLNPWNTDIMPGGSSGGSAAMVAAGAVPMAHGNDGGGSLRIPAACCGLVGLKPSRGRTPIGPDAGDGLNGLGIEHVLTRSLRDCAAMLDATEGPMPGDPYAIIRPVEARYSCPLLREKFTPGTLTASSLKWVGLTKSSSSFVTRTRLPLCVDRSFSLRLPDETTSSSSVSAVKAVSPEKITMTSKLKQNFWHNSTLFLIFILRVLQEVCTYNNILSDSFQLFIGQLITEGNHTIILKDAPNRNIKPCFIL